MIDPAIPEPQTHLSWLFQALGLFYSLALPLAGLAVLVGAVLVVALSKRPALIAAYLVFLPLPMLLGLLGSLQGALSAYQVIALSGAPKPAAMADVISGALATSLVGLVVTLPSYLVLAPALFLRTALWHGEKEAR